MDVSCVIDSSNTYNTSWVEISQAKKYLVWLNCETEIGDLKIKHLNKETNCTSEGICTARITQGDFSSALNEAVNKGNASFPQGKFLLTFSCSANVRSLPATRGIRPQGESVCKEEIQEPVIIPPDRVRDR